MAAPRLVEARYRVLIVDDDTIYASAVAEWLREAGHQVDVQTSPEGGLTQAEEEPYDVILLDLAMPIMDGWSFVTQYRRDGKAGGRIVLLTGHPNVREISASLGADAYVGKPFELTELLRTLEQQLGAIG